MNETFLPAAGLQRSEVSVGNVLRCRWQKDNKLPPEGILKVAIEQCRQYLDIPETTELIVAQGALAWRALNQVGSITEWRGYVGPNLWEAPRSSSKPVGPAAPPPSTSTDASDSAKTAGS